MPRVGFEPTIPVLHREKAFHASEHAAALTGGDANSFIENMLSQRKTQKL
jgi:hypothetical protein